MRVQLFVFIVAAFISLDAASGWSSDDKFPPARIQCTLWNLPVTLNDTPEKLREQCRKAGGMYLCTGLTSPASDDNDE